MADRRQAGGEARPSGSGPSGAAPPCVALITDHDGTIEFTGRIVQGDDAGADEALGAGVLGQASAEYRETGRETVRRVFRTGQACGYDSMVTLPSGETRWFHTDIGPLKEEGRVVAVMIATVDITKRKAAEEALRESEDRYRIVTQLSSDYAYAYRVEPDGRLSQEWVTGTLTRITGFKPEEVGDRSAWTNLVHPDDLSTAERQLELLLSGRPATVEYRIKTKGGKLLWMRDYAEPVVDDASRRVTRIFGAVKDITEQRNALRALRESEEKYRNVVERATDGIAVVLDERVRYVSPSLSRMLGYTAEELLGTPFTRYVHEDGRQRVVDRYRRRMAGEDVPSIYQTAFLHKDGHRVEVELNAGLVPYEGVTADLVFVRDITRRLRAEDELRHRIEDLTLLRTLSDAANRGMSTADILDLLSKEVARVLECRGALLYLVSDDRSEMVLQNLGGYPRALRERIEATIGMKIPSRVAVPLREHGAYREILDGGMPRLLNGPDDVKRLLADLAGDALKQLLPAIHGAVGAISVVAIPLLVAGETIGLLEASREKPFTVTDLSRLDAIARHITTILGHRRHGNPD